MEINYQNINNENVNIYDEYLDIVDKCIISGNITNLQNFINIFGNQLHKDSIEMGKNIIMQILQEKIEEL